LEIAEQERDVGAFRGGGIRETDSREGSGTHLKCAWRGGEFVPSRKLLRRDRTTQKSCRILGRGKRLCREKNDRQSENLWMSPEEHKMRNPKG